MSLYHNYCTTIYAFKSGVKKTAPVYTATAICFAADHNVPEKIRTYARTVAPPPGFNTWSEVVKFFNSSTEFEFLSTEQINAAISRMDALEDHIWGMQDYPEEIKKIASEMPILDMLSFNTEAEQGLGAIFCYLDSIAQESYLTT